MAKAERGEGLRGRCVLLGCYRCDKVADNYYKSYFKQVPNGQDIIEIETDVPLVPGTEYEVLIKGVHPSSGFANNLPCIGNVASFLAREVLLGIDLVDHQVKKYEETNR